MMGTKSLIAVFKDIPTALQIKAKLEKLVPSDTKQEIIYVISVEPIRFAYFYLVFGPALLVGR